MITDGKPKRAVLYARFSPRKNADECQSCVKQLADLRAYCRKHGIEVAAEFNDDALSGGDDWDDRPGMLRASAACRRGMLFIVRSFDRLFRDTRKGLMFAAMVEAKGASVLSITEEAASLQTPEAHMMRSILLAIAEYQRSVIRARTRSGMRDNQRRGRRMSDQTPYGYRRSAANPQMLEPDPHEQRVVAQIRALADSGLGARAIARRLNDLEVPGRAAQWHHQTVTRILSRDMAI